MALSKAEGPFGRPFDGLTVLSKVEGLTALSKVEGLRYPYPSSLRRTSMYASFLGISEALHLDIFHQPLRSRFFDSLSANRKFSGISKVHKNSSYRSFWRDRFIHNILIRIAENNRQGYEDPASTL
jgi:hypothetical protein